MLGKQKLVRIIALTTADSEGVPEHIAVSVATTANVEELKEREDIKEIVPPVKRKIGRPRKNPVEPGDKKAKTPVRSSNASRDKEEPSTRKKRK